MTQCHFWYHAVYVWYCSCTMQCNVITCWPRSPLWLTHLSSVDTRTFIGTSFLVSTLPVSCSTQPRCLASLRLSLLLFTASVRIIRQLKSHLGPSTVNWSFLGKASGAFCYPLSKEILSLDTESNIVGTQSVSLVRNLYCWYAVGVVGTEFIVLVCNPSGWYESYSVGTQSVWLIHKLQCWYAVCLVGKEVTAYLK